MIRFGPKLGLRLPVIDRKHELGVDDLSTVNLRRASVRVVRAPDSGAFLLDLVRKFYDQVRFLRRADDFILAPIFHRGIEGVERKVAPAAVREEYCLRARDDRWQWSYGDFLLFVFCQARRCQR